MISEVFSNGIIFNEDCISVLKLLISAKYKFNMIFADLPYNETGNAWDSKIDHKEMFNLLKELITDDGAMVFTGTFKFGVDLYNACPELYKYDWVWEKDNGTNAPNVNLQPFRVHENIYVFGKGRVTNGKRTPMKYNPQKTEGTPYCQKSGKMSDNWKGGLKNVVTNNPTGLRHPKTIQKFVRDKGLHPTQKPLSMMEYLIKTYTDENDLVLDFTCGSGTTLVACQNLNRKFVGAEFNPEKNKNGEYVEPDKYFKIAVQRLKNNESEIIQKGENINID